MMYDGYAVSTHSRLKAAGDADGKRTGIAVVSTHSRLKAAGLHGSYSKLKVAVSTHSRLKAAGNADLANPYCGNVSTHSRLKAAGLFPLTAYRKARFQHTAA